MPRMDRIGKTATQVFKGTVPGYEKFGEMICVQYHATVVVAFNEQATVLQTGGWRTMTTKNRMNQVSRQFNLGYNVYQANGAWFVRIGDKTYPFGARDFVINRKGLV